jgi:hypothetical protein
MKAIEVRSPPKITGRGTERCARFEVPMSVLRRPNHALDTINARFGNLEPDFRIYVDPNPI